MREWGAQRVAGWGVENRGRSEGGGGGGGGRERRERKLRAAAGVNDAGWRVCGAGGGMGREMGRRGEELGVLTFLRLWWARCSRIGSAGLMRWWGGGARW